MKRRRSPAVPFSFIYDVNYDSRGEMVIDRGMHWCYNFYINRQKDALTYESKSNDTSGTKPDDGQ